MQQIVGTLPAPLVQASTVAGINQRITVTNAAASLISLLSGGALPLAPVANTNAGESYVFGGVDLSSEVDPSTTPVRYLDNGSDTLIATLGMILPAGPSWLRILGDLSQVRLISTGGNVDVHVRLIITAINKP
jgi:hypothetical protein